MTNTLAQVDMLSAALAWHDGGLCVVQARTDGSKAPVGWWKDYQQTRPDREQVARWFTSNYPGIGIVCGRVSGGLEMFEIEAEAIADGAKEKLLPALRGAGVFEVWKRLIHGYAEFSGGGGLHVLFRITDHEVPGNVKLARRPAQPEELTDDERELLTRHPDKQILRTLAETRGEGGFVIVAPSHGPVHPTGNPWNACNGSTFGVVPAITWEERNALYAVVTAVLDQTPDPEPTPERKASKDTVTAAGDRPGDHWAREITWAQILEPHGWKVVYSRGNKDYWRRPGKSIGISARTGGEYDDLYVWSTSTELPDQKTITKFRAYSILEHRGHDGVAAGDLRRQGYGGPRSQSTAAPERDHRELPSEGAVSADSTSYTEPPDPDKAKEELAALGPDVLAGKKRSRELARQVAEAVDDPAALLDWRDLLKAYGGLPGGEFNTIAKQVTDERKKQREALAADERREQYATELAEAEARGTMLPSPADPLAVARRLMADAPRTDGAYHLTWWRDDFYRWDGTRWPVENPATLRQWIYTATEHATYDAGEVRGIQPWQPDRDKVNKVLDALGTAVIQRYASDEPDRAIAFLNGVYDLTDNRLLQHTPTRFNLTALPYPYDPAATCPQWLAFLDQVLPQQPGVPDEQQGQQFLREWFGYVISGRTDLQKMASLVGPPRCGKGTIARVLGHILGPDAVAAPTAEKLAGQFGEQNLIGKTLAILGDVRWNGRTIPEIVPILLGIVGEDARDVARKNRVDWHGKLDVRFMVMSNDTPTFNDASGALSIRMIQLGFTESFAGREDTDLTAKLVTELPGVLNWALKGLRSLTARGRFVQPASGLKIADEVRRLSSPEAAFVEDRCKLGEQYEINLDSLYAAFKGWCNEEGRDHVVIKEIFARNLLSAYRGKVATDRRRVGGGMREYVVRGLWCPPPQVPSVFNPYS